MRQLKSEMDKKVTDIFIDFYRKTGIVITGFTVTNIDAKSGCGPEWLPGTCESQIKL